MSHPRDEDRFSDDPRPPRRPYEEEAAPGRWRDEEDEGRPGGRSSPRWDDGREEEYGFLRRPPHVPNYLGPSIAILVFTTLCCSLPIGIVPVVFAAQVNTKLRQGDYEGALASSRKARLWCWLTGALAVVGFVIIIGFIVLMEAAGL
jgi:hypothetical protein